MDNNLNFLNPHTETSIDQTDPFESALSSMVSSPTASNANPNPHTIVLRELIGRLGNICNSADILSHAPPFNATANTSCFSTPISPPPNFNLSVMENQQIGRLSGNNFPFFQSLTSIPTDPGFAEREAKFSCFANDNFAGLSEIGPPPDSGSNIRVSSNRSIRISGSYPTTTVQESRDGSLHEAGISAPATQSSRLSRSSTPVRVEFGDSRENSSVSEQIPVGEVKNDGNFRKRKSIPKGKGKETPRAKDANVTASENSESIAKRCKSEDGSENEKDASKTNADTNQKQSKDNSKIPEPPKDYIHVRARRGQATDAHSLAERVRREKISERMKVLQDLVPGCNKVTGKAVMLDEIINYVQSLQRQVEFLSMKLATVNPRMDFNIEAIMPKDVFQSCGSLPQTSDSHPIHYLPNLHNAAIPCGTEPPFPTNSFNAVLARNQNLQLPLVDNFRESMPQVHTFWEDDLHGFVQMGFGQNQTEKSPNGNGIQMKVEL